MSGYLRPRARSSSRPRCRNGWPPSTRTCAQVGEIAIWRMRRSAEEALKDKFDLRAFHTVLLRSGPLPLDTLATLVDEWVSAVLAA